MPGLSRISESHKSWGAAALAVFILLILGLPPAVGCDGGDSDLIERARILLENGEWQTLLSVVSATPEGPPDLDYYRGMALAGLRQWDEARRAFECGWKKAPSDKRFPLELAGVAFRSGSPGECRRRLKDALSIDPDDPYANEFLGTVYFIEGNLDASLKYWNRIGKPHVEQVITDPEPRLHPVLLDRAYAFSRGSLLTLKELENTGANLDNLRVFPRRGMTLVARKDGDFDLTVRLSEQNGWGSSTAERLFSLLRESPYQTLHYDLYNMGRSAWNLESSIRWDAQKRRLRGALSAPISGNPKWNLQFAVDGCRENWDISRSLQRPSSLPTTFQFQSLGAEATLRFVPTADWIMESRVTISDRKFEVPAQDNGVPSELFAAGFSVRYDAQVRRRMLSNPDERLRLDLTAFGRIGRVLETAAGTFGGVGAGLEFNWLPTSEEGKLRVTARWQAAKSRGSLPLDELYSLGLERDNGLFLRGHAGLDHGRKGAGPLGPDFVLGNFEIDRAVFQGSFMELRLGPIFDTGKTYDPTGYFGLPEWQFDVGIMMKLSVLRLAEIQLSYGRSLRSGGGAFFSQISRAVPGSN